MDTPVKRLSCGVVVVLEQPRPRVLLLRAFNHWDFPKGLLESGETPLEAAVREVREETGIEDLQFRWGHEYIETGPYSRGKVARYYAAATATEAVVLGVNPELGRAEHSEYCWVTLEQAQKLTTPRVWPVLRWAQRLTASG